MTGGQGMLPGGQQPASGTTGAAPGMMGPGMMGQGMGSGMMGGGQGMTGQGMSPGVMGGQGLMGSQGTLPSGQQQGPGGIMGAAPGMMGQGMMGSGQGAAPGRGMHAMLVDRDRDGSVTADEAAAWYEEMFAALDADDDDALSGEEFAAPVRMHPGRAQAAAQQERRQARFQQMDKNNDGQVTLDEYLAAAAERFQAADRDGDGRVSVWEFRSIYRG